MNYLDILKYDSYIKEQSIFLDFTKHSPITFVEFHPFRLMNGQLEAYGLDFVKKHNVNYVGIVGSKIHNQPFITFNLNGLSNFDTWNDPFYLGKFLTELLVTKHNSKYNIFSGDCGGAYTAILAGKHAPVNSILATTPFVSFRESECYGLAKPQQLVVPHWRTPLKDWISDEYYDEVADLFPLIVTLKNRQVRMNFHWASTARKTDLFEKQRIEKIADNVTLHVHSHLIPPMIDPHGLGYWFRSISILDKLCQEEVQYAKLVLKNMGVAPSSGL
jgi:hypothetical protein